MQIPKFDLSRLTNTEYMNFMNNLVSFIERFGAEILKILSVYGLFTELLAQAKAALESERSSITVQEASDADTFRDNDYRVLYYVIKGFCFSRHQEKKKAANRIMRILKDDGNPLAASLDSETTLLVNIVSTLNTPEYTGFVDTLGVRELLDDIAESNGIFIGKRLNRTDEITARDNINIGKIRKEIRPVYDQMVAAVNGLVVTEPDVPVYKDFIKLVNAEIKRFRTIIAQRKARKQSTINS